MQHHPTILHRNSSALLIIDVQERLVKAMNNRASVEAAISTLQQGMAILNVPTLITEQYPRGLGATIPGILEQNPEASVVEKTTFSCCGEESFWPELATIKRRQIIVTGIETHVCVLQTVLDLINAGYQVHLPVSATCSRADENRDNAIRRMEKAGAIITNVESVLFELLRAAGNAEFKAISKLVV
jgi:nicotinamidase-related amidase